MSSETTTTRHSAMGNGQSISRESADCRLPIADCRIDLPSALHHCKQITRSRARNFYYGLKLLPEPQRSAMYALYAWMRAADDLVDGAAATITPAPTAVTPAPHPVTPAPHAFIPAQAGIHGAPDAPEPDSPPGGKDEERAANLRASIESFREATSRALAGQPPAGDPMWVGLAFAAERFQLSEGPFHAMLAGQLDDLRERRYQTFEELREYCYRVASTVGLLCIEIWGYSDPAAKNLAIDRGIAFQMTNILRDFKEDFDCGRVYLPQEDFDAHTITPDDLRRWSKPQRCESFIASQVERASAFYESSSRLDELISPPCLPTLWAMTTIYRSLLRKIRADPPMLVSDRRVRLSFVSKTMIALRARTGRLSG